MPPLDAWEAALVFCKAATYGATLAAAGGVLFTSYSHDLLSRADLDAMQLWVRTLAGIAAAASGVNVLLTAGSMSGDVRGMFDLGLTRMIWSGGESRAIVLRLIGLALMSAGPFDAPRLRAAPLTGVIFGATSFAWVGHTHAAAGALPVIALAVHLLCVSFWLGALVPLLMVARRADSVRLAAIASRFGGAAVVVVGLLVAAGACLLCFLLASFADLWLTPYGRSALIKLALVVCLLSLAALNRWWLTPRLRAHPTNSMRPLQRSIQAELAVSAGILIATAVLTTLTGPTHSP